VVFAANSHVGQYDQSSLVPLLHLKLPHSFSVASWQVHEPMASSVFYELRFLGKLPAQQVGEFLGMPIISREYPLFGSICHRSSERR